MRLRATINDRLFFDAAFLFPRGLSLFVSRFIVKRSVIAHHFAEFQFPVLMQGQAEVPQDKVEAIHRGYRVLEQYLMKSQFLASNGMTVADLCVFAWMESITQVVPVSEKDCSRVSSWLDTMRRLPYYEEANKVGADLHIKLFNEALKRNIKQ